MSRAFKDLVTKLWSAKTKQRFEQALSHRVREEEPNMGFKKVKVDYLTILKLLI